ncbi:WSC domain-containing protein [Hippea maritima]|uniref:Carbohydrate-binding WSC n=1 Tax=Hippea maritima (strain ATCC 700847 / DSM 10411 / MH2) TaxID=760142 RepID=F2LUA4_HIPMA|nr:WSC domain-containing protein [Hippea maritima]AEA34567.1 Carbohydrate-binding WSC [Hippea maritima DSM 10411]
MKKMFIVFLLVLLIPIRAYTDVISNYFNFVQNKNLSGIKQLLYNPTPDRLKVYKVVFAAVNQRVNSVRIKKTQVFGDKAIVTVHANVTIYNRFNKRSFNEDNDLVFLLQKQSNKWKIAKVMPLADFILKKKLLIVKNALDKMSNTNKNQGNKQSVIYNTAEGGENFLNNNKNNNPYKPNNNYTYLGCFKDQGDPFGLRGRDLAAFGFRSDRMTPNLCMRECARRGYRYAGVQYSGYCFCGNRYARFGRATNCNMRCTGDSNKICGGSWANDVYDVSGPNVPRLYYSSGVEPNTDRPGSDYKNFNLPYPDYRLCQNACNKDPQCKAWTYVKPYTIQGAYARCWLKNAIPNPVKRNCCISGIKHNTAETTKTFKYPKINGYRLDWCRLWAQDCGKGAADEFCKKMGFKRAISFEEDYDIGAKSPTYVIDDGKICNQGFCDGFRYITCAGKNQTAKTTIKNKANTQNRATTSINCKDAYREFVKSYNRVVGLMSAGKSNTPEAKSAYAEYKIAREKYYSCKNKKNNQTPHYSIDKCAVYQDKQDYISMRYPEYLSAKKHYVNLTCSVYMLPKGSRIKAEWYYVTPNQDYLIGQKTVTVNRTSPKDKYVNFRIENNKEWPAGLYRVRIMLNGKEIDVISFKVR